LAEIRVGKLTGLEVVHSAMFDCFCSENLSKITEWRFVKMADFVVAGTQGEAFLLSDNSDGTFANPFQLANFPNAYKRYVLALGGNDVIQGTTNIDQVNGNLGLDAIDGGEGDDFILGGKEDDLLGGSAGNDYLNGNNNNDYLLGGDGNDILRGGKDNDQLLGEAGQDKLVGDFGSDILTGGTEADLFILRIDTLNDVLTGITYNNLVTNVLVADRMTDFNMGEADKIVLPGVQSFADLILEATVDVDANGVTDTAIKLSGGYVGVVLDVTGLTASNFIFDPQGATAILDSAAGTLLTPPPLSA
jgi:Ca2+-binding RTX toxin-like protein